MSAPLIDLDELRREITSAADEADRLFAHLCPGKEPVGACLHLALYGLHFLRRTFEPRGFLLTLGAGSAFYPTARDPEAVPEDKGNSFGYQYTNWGEAFGVKVPLPVLLEEVHRGGSLPEMHCWVAALSEDRQCVWIIDLSCGKLRGHYDLLRHKPPSPGHPLPWWEPGFELPRIFAARVTPEGTDAPLFPFPSLRLPQFTPDWQACALSYACSREYLFNLKGQHPVAGEVLSSLQQATQRAAKTWSKT